MLLVFLWDLCELNDYDVFYIDTDNLSLKNAESFIEKEICILRGYLGILENIK
jgi:hypothetical protein